MRKIKERSLISIGLITLFIGIVVLLSINPVQAEEIDTAISGKILTATPQGSDPITVFLVSPLGDAIKRSVNIGSTLRDDLRVFHISIIIGAGGGEVSFTASGDEDDEVLFASFGNSTGTDEEGTVVSTRLFGYAESGGEYTLTFSTESFATAIIVTVPLYPVGHWSAPITLTLAASME
jgi:hypothetical protein